MSNLKLNPSPNTPEQAIEDATALLEVVSEAAIDNEGGSTELDQGLLIVIRYAQELLRHASGERAS